MHTSLVANAVMPSNVDDVTPQACAVRHDWALRGRRLLVSSCFNPAAPQALSYHDQSVFRCSAAPNS